MALAHHLRFVRNRLRPGDERSGTSGSSLERTRPMAHGTARTAAQPRGRLLTTFAAVALGVLVVATLYWAQTIFIPIALAVFLTFLLAPVVERLERWVGR